MKRRYEDPLDPLFAADPPLSGPIRPHYCRYSARRLAAGEESIKPDRPSGDSPLGPNPLPQYLEKQYGDIGRWWWGTMGIPGLYYRGDPDLSGTPLDPRRHQGRSAPGLISIIAR